MLENVRIVMVNTSHSGNIGAAARAMKTMGLSDLVLVAPEEFPSATATALASGASDLLARARVVPTLEAALADCSLVIGTSARLRTIPWPLMTARECGEVTRIESEKQRVAIVFGREARGLTNEELRLCTYHVCIPANDEYGVLNVAAAIQVIAYEIRQAHLAVQGEPPADGPMMPVNYVRWDEALVSHEEMELFYHHFERVLIEVGFLAEDNPRQLMTRARRMFNRVRLDRLEYNMLRGFLTSTQQKLKQRDSD